MNWDDDPILKPTEHGEAAATRVRELQHAMQTGVALTIAKDPNRDFANIRKHLRVGINAALVQDGALVVLLIRKGVITPDEYWQSQMESYEREVAMYEQELGVKLA